MNDNEAQLQDLGIELVSQSALENEIETNAQSLINKQTLEQEHNRLERAENALQKLTTRREVLKRKKAAATRISVRSKLQEQIDELEENELQTLRKDVLDVKTVSYTHLDVYKRQLLPLLSRGKHHKGRC